MARLKDKGKLTVGILLLAVFLISSVVFAAGGSGGGGRPGGGGNMGHVEMSESVINVKLSNPQVGSLSRETDFIGRIEPSETVNVYPEVSGKVTKIHVEAGDTVQAGQLLFEIDDTDAQMDYQLQLLRNEGSKISANTSLGSSFDSDLINSENSLKSAQQSLNTARLKLKDYNDGLDDQLLDVEKEMDRVQVQMDQQEAVMNEIEAAGQLSERREEYNEASRKYAELVSQKSGLRTKQAELEDDEDSTARDLRNSYRNAQTSYQTALERYKLLQGGSLEDKKASVDVDLKSADLQLEQMAAKLGKYKVYAPIGGVVESKAVTLHENEGTNQAAFTISNKDVLSVKFNATADAVAALSLGDQVNITKSGRTQPAAIFEIDSKADASTGLFPVKAQLEGTDGALLNGVTVKVSAATAKAENALLVPLDVVYYDEGQAYVFTYADGKARRADIETGMSDAKTIVVESGLSRDSQIITTWHPDLKDGVSVNLAGAQDDRASGREQGAPAQGEKAPGGPPAQQPDKGPAGGEG